MAIIQTTLKEFIKDSTLFEKKRKRKMKKKKKTGKRTNKGMSPSWYRAGGYGLHNNHYGGDSNMGGADGGGGMGESLITELLSGIVSGSFSSNMAIGPAYSKHSNNPEAGMTTYASDDPGDWEWAEEEIETVNKEMKAFQLFNSMINRPNVSRQDIVTAIMNSTGATESTAITYYTRFHKGMKKQAATNDTSRSSDIGTGVSGGNPDDLPMTNMANDVGDSVANVGDQEMESPQSPPEIQVFDDPTKAGVIRTVKNAHLVYKKQTEDGTFTELWIYNIHRNSHDELDIRRSILAGTDIPKTKTRSVDGIQHYTITTMGNAQLLKINGLYN